MKKILISATIATVALGTIVPAGFAGAVTAADLQTQINALLAQLSTLQSQLTTVQGGTGSVTGVPSGFTFAKALAQGSTGTDVKYLQIVLNSDSATRVAASGAGSPGKETTTFGPATKAAVIKFQEKYASSVLTPSGLSKGTGLVGPATRTKLNAVLAGSVSTTPTTPTTPTVTPTTNQFSVSLASSTPVASSVVTGQALAPLTTFAFANGTGSSVKVTSLKLKRLGVSADTTLANVYLFDGATRLTDAASVTSGVITFNLSSGIFSVDANSVKNVTVYTDIAASTSGQTVGAGINAATDITATATATGTFPVNGNTMNVASATPATIDFNTTTTPSDASIDPQNDYTVWQNIITVGTRSVDFSRISLRQIGSVRNTDLQNFRLYVDGIQVGSAVQNLDSNGYATFDLSASPKRLETGSRTIKVLGDIIGGSNLNFQFSLRNTADATFKDSQLAVAILATANSSTFSARSTGTETVNKGVVTITKRADSPAGNVVLSATSVTLAKYDVKAAGEPVKIENLIATVIAKDSTGAAKSSIGRLRNGAIFANGVQIGSTSDLYEVDGATSTTQYNLGSSLIVQPGSPVVLEVRADVYDNDGTNSIVAGDTLQARINTGASNGFAQVSNTSSNVPASNQAANSVTVQTGALTLSVYTSFAGPTYVVPQTNAKIGHFVITAGSTEDVNLNTITFDYTTGTAGNVTNVYGTLGTDTLSTKATITASGNSWSVNKTIPSGTSMDLVLYAGSIVSETGTAAIFANVTGTTTGSATTVYGAATNTAAGRVVGQLVTYGSGTFTSAKDGSTPLDGVVAAGQTVTAGAFKFSAQNDSFTIQEVRFRVAASAANAIASATLMNGTTPIQTKAFTVTDSNLNDTVAFTNLTTTVAANTTKLLTVNVTLADVSGTNSGASGTQVKLTNTYLKYTSSTGTLTTSTTPGAGSTNPASNTLVVYEGYPTFTADNGSLNTTAIIGALTTLYQFKVKANGGTIALKQLKFKPSFSDINATTPAKLDQFKLLKAGTDITGNVTIRNELGLTIEGTANAVSSTTGSTGPMIYVTWDAGNEDAIGAGQEYTYQLQGVPAGFETVSTVGSDTVSIALDNSANDTTYTTSTTGKYLANQSSNIYALATSAGQTTGTAADIVWSDNSVVGHLAAHDSTGTGDWTASYLVQTLPSPPRTLKAP